MKSAAVQSLHAKLAADQPVYGLWVTLESASITEMAVAVGLDWVVIDAEHGHLDWGDILDHVRAAVRSNTVVLVRIAELQQGLVKRVLDIGADGVVVPWVETVEQLEAAVRFANYPPEGVRGIGGERATCWGACLPQHVEESQGQAIVAPIVESVEGGRNIEKLVNVEGVDLFFTGPADYSSTAGYAGQWEGPGVAEQILHVKDVIRKAGKQIGLVTTGPDDLAMRRDQGFRALGLGLDGALLVRSMLAMLDSTGRPATKIDSALCGSHCEPRTPAEAAAEPIQSCAPPGFEPDRPEVMNWPEQAAVVDIQTGVHMRPLVGSHNNARHLTTGLVTFDPDETLAYHTHPFAESITLLEGSAIVEVEGRRYAVGPLDNVFIPPGIAHCVLNTSARERALFHVSLASDAPSRDLVERFFSKRKMPDDSAGVPGKERVNRDALVERYEANPGALFVDYMNRKLTGIDAMSGGYGRFQPNAQLPCHIHDFDESICIIEGSATCVVEGQRYTLHSGATALVPRGRCHYFINETDAPMAMIWVYAGPMPERITLDARCCNLPRSQMQR